MDENLNMDMDMNMEGMERWKIALILGAAGAGIALMLAGRRPAGLVLAGLGVAYLASENPERFQEIWEKAPDYLDKANRVVTQIAEFADRISEQGHKLHEITGRTGTYRG